MSYFEGDEFQLKLQSAIATLPENKNNLQYEVFSGN